MVLLENSCSFFVHRRGYFLLKEAEKPRQVAGDSDVQIVTTGASQKELAGSALRLAWT